MHGGKHDALQNSIVDPGPGVLKHDSDDLLTMRKDLEAAATTPDFLRWKHPSTHRERPLHWSLVSIYNGVTQLL